MKIDRILMRDELIKSSAQGKWTIELTNIMMDLANGVAHHQIYKCVNDKEDMIQDGLCHLLQIWYKFDAEHASGNPFGYFTRSLFRHYTKYFNKAIKRNKRETTVDDSADYDQYE